MKKIRNKINNMDIVRVLKEQFDKLKSSFSSMDKELSSKEVKKKQILLLSLVAISVLTILYLFFSLSFSSKKKELATEDTQKKKMKVEIAGSSVDPEKMWRNHFEEKLQDSSENIKHQIGQLEETVSRKSDNSFTEAKREIDDLKGSIAMLRDQLEETSIQLKNIIDSQEDVEYETQNNIEAFLADQEQNISLPKDGKIYLPETSFVEGTLLGGIAVSTSVGSSSEPVPVIIRLTGKGNLPDNFNVNLKDCRVLGSSYGDLSSERAVVRAETLVCTNKSTDEIITTKVAGLVYGDDGMNGIKGKVIDMSTKHIKNAAIGGMLSGFANTMKPDGQFTLSSVGAVNTKKRGIEDKAKDNLLSGAGNAADKIADYYIKQAENMSPVLVIPGGSRVDLVFTKGVYLGSSDVKESIKKERKSDSSWE
jgi:conjugal transfer pilus assembly protein TraB